MKGIEQHNPRWFLHVVSENEDKKYTSISV